ncbi:MAG: LPS export ABC transporter permease LptF [Pseudomonadota bacterium]
MSRFDRYLLSQLIALFGFFSLVLVAVYWVNRAVGLFDKLIGNGHSALVFLEFSLLTLPNVIRLVLPISAFAASVYVTNRLTQESELVVMQATGFSAFRLARPVLAFGLFVAVLMLLLTNVLVPTSRAMLADRSATLTENATAQFLNDGQFMHPAKGTTLYIREITAQGELLDLFLSDDRDPNHRTIYTARRALLARGDAGPKLLMFDGISQRLTREDRRMSITRFADFTYDIGGLIAGSEPQARSPEEVSTWALITAQAPALAALSMTPDAVRTEVHMRLSAPFLATAAALIGFATLLIGAFSRFGLWRQIIAAVLLLILLQVVNTTGTSAAQDDPASWPLLYASPVLGLIIGCGLLWQAQRPRRVGPVGGAPA